MPRPTPTETHCYARVGGRGLHRVDPGYLGIACDQEFHEKSKILHGIRACRSVGLVGNVSFWRFCSGSSKHQIWLWFCLGQRNNPFRMGLWAKEKNSRKKKHRGLTSGPALKISTSNHLGPSLSPLLIDGFDSQLHFHFRPVCLWDIEIRSEGTSLAGGDEHRILRVSAVLEDQALWVRQ